MLQEVRMARVLDAIGLHQAGRLSCAEAAELLGMSERHFRRLRDAYEAEGTEGLVDLAGVGACRAGERAWTRSRGWSRSLARATSTSRPSTSTRRSTAVRCRTGDGSGAATRGRRACCSCAA